MHSVAKRAAAAANFRRGTGQLRKEYMTRTIANIATLAAALLLRASALISACPSHPCLRHAWIVAPLEQCSKAGPG